MFFGPVPYSKAAKLNFVYHPNKSESTNIYLNTKGQSINMYTKLVDGKEKQDTELQFPDDKNSDYKNKNENVK
ncbi:MAG: hypothetical protein DHS20C13_30590 [Thermodesulfobacteriota bacterium]|nr:MAG: hypothetical protein DHS20C13_30590 [Thermodesulfobacteriota bacterium]